MVAGHRADWQRRAPSSAGVRSLRGGRLALVGALLLATSFAPGTARADSARLSLSTATLSFPTADPDVVPVIDAAENPVAVGVDVRGATSSQLTALAAGDLVSGPDQIPIAAVHWTGQGDGFAPAGTLSKNDPQLVGQWVGRVDTAGSLWFQLDNSWSYPTGDYGQTVVYTLVAY